MIKLEAALCICTVILAGVFYYTLQDPSSKMGRYIDPMTHTLAESDRFDKQVKASVSHLNDDNYETLYIEAMLAVQQGDYRLATLFFDRLYDIRPKDMTYYRAYATSLLHTNPKAERLQPLISALMEAPERDTETWLIFAQFELVNHNTSASNRYYDEALALETPGTPLYEEIQRQKDMLR